MEECEFCGEPAPDPVENRGGYVFCSVRCGQEFERQVEWEKDPGAPMKPEQETATEADR